MIIKMSQVYNLWLYEAIMSTNIKSYDLFAMILSISICFIWSGCGTTMSSIEEEYNVDFKVVDSNASYFDVKERMEFIQKHNLSNWSRVEWYRLDCSKLPIPKPVDYYLVMPALYENRAGWEKANAPLKEFESHVTRMAELYVTKADNSYAKCLVKTLSTWAEKDSLLNFDYEGNQKQAWYAIEWATSSAALAYSIVKDNPSIKPEIKQKIEIWLKKVAKKQISYPGGPKTCCNNHSYWRGLEAAITGVVTNDNYLFRFGILKYISAMKSMNQNGSFPLEMARGRRALHYQNFAILPLVYIAEIAARQGYDLYSINIYGKDLHLAINFLMNCLQDNNDDHGCPRKPQDTSFTRRRENKEVNWMEPYNRRFRNKDIESFLKYERPTYHRWGGGNSTLYFYSPEIK
jgi:poly(beta-D-mannuronate) lyase